MLDDKTSVFFLFRGHPLEPGKVCLERVLLGNSQ